MMNLLSRSKQTNSPLAKRIEEVTAAAAQGNLEMRVTGIDMKDPLAKAAWNLNNLLDQMEAMMRNTTTAIESANKGISYRKVFCNGLKGNFQTNCKLIAIATATVLFPSVSKALKNNQEDKAYANLNTAFWLLAFLLGASMIGGILLAEPIVWLLFERHNFTIANTLETVSVLQMYMIGLLPFGLAKLFSMFLYASHRHLKAAKIAIYSLITSVTFSFILMQPMGASGLALAGSIGGWVLFILTVKEVGFDKFTAIVKSKKSLYFVVAMIGFSIIIYFVNMWLITLIR